MTSTYLLPFFPFLTVPPFLADGPPIRSSSELALLTPLMPVAGRDGGCRGGTAAAGGSSPAAGESTLDGGPEPGALLSAGEPVGSGGNEADVALEAVIDGGGAPLTDRDGGPVRGGGRDGAGDGDGDPVAPAFLFTHLFVCSSYTNELLSPSLAL